MGSFAQLVSTESPQLLKSVKTEWNTCPLKDFHLGRMNIFIVMLKKCPIMQGMRGGVASSVSSFCIPSHSSVWIHDSVDKAQLPHTFSTHSSYIRALLPLNVTVGTKHFSLYSSSSTPEHFGCFWIRNDWLGLLRPEYGFPEVSIL